MRDRTKRSILRWATGALWGATVAVAVTDISTIRVFHTLWLATLIVSLWTLAVWLTRPDHGILSHVRLKLAAMRLDGAIADEARGRQESRSDDHRPDRHLNSVS